MKTHLRSSRQLRESCVEEEVAVEVIAVDRHLIHLLTHQVVPVIVDHILETQVHLTVGMVEVATIPAHIPNL